MNFIVVFFKNLIYKETNIYVLTFSLCLGNYIAFSPFIGFHTLMALLLSPLLGLNMPIVMATSHAINNPFTMVPIYLFDYYIGHYIVHTLFARSLCLSTPWWMYKIEHFIVSYLQVQSPCIWSFLIGGNVIGVVSSILLFPVLLYSIRKIV